MRQRRRIASGSPIGLPGFFFVGGGFAGSGGGGGSKPPPYGVLWGVRYSFIRPSVRTGASSLGGRLFGGVMPLGGYTASGLSGHLLLPGEGNTAVSNSGTDVQVRQSDAGKFGVEQYGELLHQAGLDWDTAGQLNGAALQVSSNSVANRSVAAPSLTTAQSGSMKAAGPQQRAVAADAEGYAKLLQEVMPEFAAENGWNIVQAVPMQKAKEYMDSKRTNSPVAKSLINDRMNSNGWKNRGIQFFAKIPEGKFLQYALNPEKSPDKARAFQAALGYDLNNYSELIQNIAEHTDESKFVEKGDIGYGMRYEFVMNLTGANGKNANVLTAWVQDGDEKRLTSVYITKKKVTE